MMLPAVTTGLAVLVAAGRPGDLALPLFFHVAGAAALIGAAATAATIAVLSGPDVEVWARRLAFRVALLAALPAYLVMRVAAEMVHSREFGGAASDPGWVVLGYITADGGFVLLVAATVLVWLSARRRSRRLAVAAAVILAVAGAAWVVTVWAMSAKPF
jgi:hypothetical protein